MLALAMTSLFLVQHTTLASGRLLDPKHRLGPGSYVGAGVDGKPVIIVRGQDFTLDLTARTLTAVHTNGHQQDSYEGIGILLDSCKNVTLKNVKVTGFRTNIVLKNCTNVHILGSEADQSRAIRMSRDGKPIDTFLNLRSVDAWRKYGAGIWLENCSQCTIEHSKASRAQNGIVLVNTNYTTLFDNECSWNGGWGIALWHAERNTIAWNHADFCNRPWAGGWGGDAAGVVLANLSYSNQIIWNSFTHGGDGFFMTDGLDGGFNKVKKTYDFSTGSNNNFVAHNDGSWSSNNAFEGTYSTSTLYYGNIAEESNYGFWLGFSDNSFLFDNEIRRNRTDGVAIGQGRSAMIFRNRINGNQSAGVHLWSEGGPAELAKPSAYNRVYENQISESKFAVQAERSQYLFVAGNTVRDAQLAPKMNSTMPPRSEVLRLSNWRHSGTARRIDSWQAKRPKTWEFYRDTSGLKGQDALTLGEFTPAPKK